MHHAEKMILVSPDALTAVKERPTSTENVTVSKLDQEMKDILSRLDMNPYDKVQQYNQILQRYLAYYNKSTRQPISVKVKDMTPHMLPIDVEGHNPPPNDEPAEGVAVSQSPDLDNLTIRTKLLSHFPVNLKKKGEAILSSMHDSDGVLTWNRQGELIHSGRLIKGSHVSDLVYDILQDRRGQGPPTGFDEFVKGLVEINIPERLVTNSNRRIKLQQLKHHGWTPPSRTSRIDEPPPSSKQPKRRKKSTSVKRTARVGRLNWESYTP